jgi:hypothetical protein
MDAKNTELEDFSCELTEQDLKDIHDMIDIGKVSWSPREKRAVTHHDSQAFRVYTPYDPNNSSNINFSVATAKYFALQPGFWRVCASTNNRKLYKMFEDLVNRAITLYNKPFSMVACILSDTTIVPHVHFIDPTRNVSTTTYYWTLTNNPLDCDFIYRQERLPLFKQGFLEFDPATSHGAEFRDNNMRLFVLIDSA